jgi:hypothetical protein
MNNPIVLHRLPALALVAALLSSGCATTAKVSRFEAFAAAGGQYSTALGALLAEAGTVLVDANSDKVLQSAADFPGAVTRDEFKEQDRTLRLNLTELELLGRQVSVLADYFDALSRLATTKAPEAVGAELQRTVASLNGLTSSLGKANLIRSEAGAAQLAQGLGTLVVRGVQLRALERELAARRQTIAEILRLHQALLAALEAQIGSDLELERSRRYESEVMQPFLAGAVSNHDGWKTKRRELLRKASVVEQAQAAGKAAEDLQAAWAMLLSGKLDSADVQAVVNDLEPILAGLAGIKKV